MHTVLFEFYGHLIIQDEAYEIQWLINHTRSLSQALAGLGFKCKGLLGALNLMGGYKVSSGVRSRNQGGCLGYSSQSPEGKCEVSMGTQLAPALPARQGQSHKKPHRLMFDFPIRMLGEASRMPQGQKQHP